MKKNLLLIAVTLLLACGSTQTKTNTISKTTVLEKTDIKNVDPTIYGKSITSIELKEKLYYYASDTFEGRETGEKGQKMAVNYLKENYVSLGIPSALPNDDYFQKVPLSKQKSPVVTITVNGKSLNQFDDFIAYGSTDSRQISVDDIVFVGYGVESNSYSDYTNLNVKDKIVLIKEGEPKNEDGTYAVSGTLDTSKWSNGRQGLTSKRDLAKEKGAKASFIMDNAMFKRYAPYYKSFQESDRYGRISLDSDEIEMLQIIITEEFAKTLFPDFMDVNKPQNVPVKVSIDVKSTKADVSSENVAAFIRGSEYPNEVIVISAHLDHEGVKDGEVYNGADDDGSGTVGILEIAEAFEKAISDGYTPKRSILFLHFTGEEKGLLGSQYYTDIAPIFPLANTVVDLNMDMIGRVDESHEANRNFVYLIGSDKLSSELHMLSEEVNRKYTNISLDYTYNNENDPNRYYYRSDHYNFAKNNVPVIFYFNGTHDDYHKPTDTPEKIQYDLLETRTRLVFYTAWELANRDNRIIVDKLTVKVSE